MSISFSIVIPEEDYILIEKLSEEGNSLADKKNFDGAIKKFTTALNVLPEPKEKWEAALWLYTSIGDMFLSGEKYQQAVDSYYQALNCHDGKINAFVHLRLGETLYELKDEKKSLEHLMRAYMLDGEEIFADEDSKYFEFLKSNVRL